MKRVLCTQSDFMFVFPTCRDQGLAARWQASWKETLETSNGTTIKRNGIIKNTAFRFAYATRVFDDPERIDIDAARIDDGEIRRKVLGRIDGRLFTAVYVMRDASCRLIWARRSNAKEERAYGDRDISA